MFFLKASYSPNRLDASCLPFQIHLPSLSTQFSTLLQPTLGPGRLTCLDCIKVPLPPGILPSSAFGSPSRRSGEARRVRLAYLLPLYNLTVGFWWAGCVPWPKVPALFEVVLSWTLSPSSSNHSFTHSIRSRKTNLFITSPCPHLGKEVLH